jgi:TonB family protein
LFAPAILLLISLVLAAQTRSPAQVGQTPEAASETDLSRGIALYKNGDDTSSIVALRSYVKLNEKDFDGWYCLGLALNRKNQIGEARKAFERALRLQPDSTLARTAYAYLLLRSDKLKEARIQAEKLLQSNSPNHVAHYVAGAVAHREGNFFKALTESELAIKDQHEFAPALLLKSQALFGLYLTEVPASEKERLSLKTDSHEASRLRIKEAENLLQRYLSLTPDNESSAFWRQQLQTLQAYTGSSKSVFYGTQVTTKVRVLSKPEPEYTTVARSKLVQGKVVLRAVFDADGEVKYTLVLRALPYGLTEAAIEAARKIKFIPAVKDGIAVSMYMQLEYNFQLQ